MKNLEKILMSELDTAGLASAARAQATTAHSGSGESRVSC